MEQQNRFVCDLCGKTFSTKQRRDTHIEKKVCGDSFDMTEKTPEPPKPEPTPEQPKPEQSKPVDDKKIGLFDEQKKTYDPDIFKCGSCRYKSFEKFRRCPACGDINDFED